MTEKLYDLDPYTKEFDAAVISCGEVTLPVFKETLKQIEKNGHSGPDTKYYEIILDKRPILLVMRPLVFHRHALLI